MPNPRVVALGRRSGAFLKTPKLPPKQLRQLVSRLRGSERTEAEIVDVVVPALLQKLGAYEVSSFVEENRPSWRQRKGNLELLIESISEALKSHSHEHFSTVVDLLAYGPNGIDQQTRSAIMCKLRSATRSSRVVPERYPDDSAFVEGVRSTIIQYSYAGVPSDSLEQDLQTILSACHSAYDQHFKDRVGSGGRPRQLARLTFCFEVASVMAGFGYNVYATRDDKLTKFEGVLHDLLDVKPDLAKELARTTVKIRKTQVLGRVRSYIENLVKTQQSTANTWTIDKKTFEDEICKGFKVDCVKRILIRRGWMPAVRAGGPAHAIVITSRALEDEIS